MWHPKNRDTLSIFKCSNPDLGLDSFTTFPTPSKNGVFTLNSDEIIAIQIIKQTSNDTNYVEYLRKHDIVIQHQTVKVNRQKKFQKQLFYGM